MLTVDIFCTKLTNRRARYKPRLSPAVSSSPCLHQSNTRSLI